MSKQGYMSDHTLLSCMGFIGKVLSIVCVFFLSLANAQDEKEKTEDKKTERKADFSVAVKGDEQTLSSEFTAKAGKWQVGESPKCFQITAEPLVEGRIEFGPSYRDTELILLVESWAKSGKRIYPRMGIGLFGKNGFYLRAFPAQKRIELIRRGVVLTKAPFAWKSGGHYLFELSVKADGEDWKVSGRVWPKKGVRPDKPQLDYKAWSDELLFPLAGRSSAVATAFSGLPISFNRVEIYKKEEEPAPDAEGVKKDDSG